MIASLNGTIKDLREERLIIEVSGIGYQVAIPTKVSEQIAIGNSILLFTSLVVREDSMSLFGFLKAEERDLFELLQTVSGIGPKVALAVLGNLSIEEFTSAISRKDTKTISAVPGIGSKGAQRMILELGTKLNNEATKKKNKKLKSVSARQEWREQLVAALNGLGFTFKDSENAVNDLSERFESDYLSKLSSSEILKLALAQTKSARGIAK